MHSEPVTDEEAPIPLVFPRAGKLRPSAADWEFKDKLGASGLVVLYPDEAVVIGDYGVDDGETETGTGLLCGEVWLEEAWSVVRRYAVTGVRDGAGDQFEFRIEIGFYTDLAVTLYGSDCVV